MHASIKAHAVSKDYMAMQLGDSAGGRQRRARRVQRRAAATAAIVSGDNAATAVDALRGEDPASFHAALAAGLYKETFESIIRQTPDNRIREHRRQIAELLHLETGHTQISHLCH